MSELRASVFQHLANLPEGERATPQEIVAATGLDAEAVNAFLAKAKLDNEVLEEESKLSLAPHLRAQFEGAGPLENPAEAVNNKSLPSWVWPMGVVAGVATLLYLMVMAVLAATNTVQLTQDVKFPLVAVLAVGAGLSSGLFGGTAHASGRLPVPLLPDSPVKFSVGGGAAIAVIFFFLGAAVYPDSGPFAQTIHIETADRRPVSAEVRLVLGSQPVPQSTNDQGDASFTAVPREYMGEEVTLQVVCGTRVIHESNVELTGEYLSETVGEPCHGQVQRLTVRVRQGNQTVGRGTVKLMIAARKSSTPRARHTSRTCRRNC